MSSNRLAVQKLGTHTEPYNYLPSGDGTELAVADGAVADWNAMSLAPGRALEQREKQGFERGVQEGEARARKSFEQAMASARTAIACAIEEFKTQRKSYFNRVEPEVVQLALGIARKILHREAQMDPLLLAGMVHVALEKLDQGTHVRLRSHPDEVHFWNAHFSESTARAIVPEIIGDQSLKHGECVLETEIGSTQISLETQLKEIEQGFFDLLELRPQVR
ncbi:MAG: FliH/SctL family protein [Candidatus Acidiferrum sp.]